jgi:hypothetical protein
VHFHIPSGKPDKKRRPGRPWDPSVFSQKDTFCGGAADVFAFNQSVDKMRMGSESSLQKIMSQVGVKLGGERERERASFSVFLLITAQKVTNANMFS